MNKPKLFLENFFIYGLGSVLGKAVPLLILPVITRLMPNSSYMGIYDLSITVVSFGSAIALMGMYDAMFRLFFDRDDGLYKKEVCSTAAGFVIASSGIILVLMLLASKLLAGVVFKDVSYTKVVLIASIAMFAEATSSIIAAPTRMQNKRKVFLVTNTVAPILSYSVAIILLLKGHYVIALPLGVMLSKVTMEIPFFVMNRSWFNPRLFRKELLRPLLEIGAPVMPVFLIYWVFHSCDRLMITNMMDLSAVGVYAVGAKLGSASQLIYTAFAGGWQYFAFVTMKEKNQVTQNSLVFEYLGIISFVATMLVSTFSFLFFHVVFQEAYLQGFIVAPYLFFSPLLLMLYQVIGNQFLVIKKTWYAPIVLSTGAISNVALNRILIPVFGIEGAAIGTLSGYLITVIISALLLTRKHLLIVSGRFMLASLVMTVFCVIWRMWFVKKVITSFLLSILCGTLFVYLYRSDILKLSEQLNVNFLNKKADE